MAVGGFEKNENQETTRVKSSIYHYLYNNVFSHGGYAPLWAGVFIGGTIGLTREIVLRHRAKKMAKTKGK